MRIITVVMGEPDSQRRNAETTAMLDYAFSQYKVEEILSKDSVLATKRIEKGKKAYVDIVPLETVTLLTKKTEKIEQPNYELKINKITSPVKKGEVVGTLKMTLNDTERTINLTVKEDAEKANIIELYLRNLIDTIDGNMG